ncbi:DNA-binding response regulator [Pyxidicoccus trucidator]|uniref:DNA-binding response regulator n=1 Tax=Pyxidicoccus trucidator TaxID=2709662 RepID=UPI0013D907BF|nr:DNA-binding response regulator [Pyxidicoccus trucidator]
MESPRTARAFLLGGDASLSSLLADVLGELGIAVELDGGALTVRPDLALVHVERGASIQRLLWRAREVTGDGPIIVLVPFADERLVQLAIRLGARDCFALGRPLDELRRVLLAHLPGSQGSAFTSSGGAEPPTSGDDP